MATTLFIPRFNKYWYAVLPAALAIWLALRLYLTWRGAGSSPELIAGLLPWQDGSHFYTDARSLVNGDQVGPIGMRRPVNIILLGLRFYLANGNLQAALAIGVALLGLHTGFGSLIAADAGPKPGGIPAKSVDVGTEGDGDFKIGPVYTDAPELAANMHVSASVGMAVSLMLSPSALRRRIRGPSIRPCRSSLRS